MLKRIGNVLFAISMIAFGIQNIVYKGFLKGDELTPEWLPMHAFFAYLMGAILIAGGIGVLIHFREKLSGTLLGILFFSTVLLLRLPRIAIAVHDISERTVLLEPLAIGCAAWLIAYRKAAWARIVFGLTMIVFGCDHFPILKFIATLIPHWLPGAFFWAWFTGAAMIAAGLAIVARVQLRLAASCLGLMFFLWVAVLHAPRVAVNLHNADEWNSLFVALAMCGGSWILLE